MAQFHVFHAFHAFSYNLWFLCCCFMTMFFSQRLIYHFDVFAKKCASTWMTTMLKLERIRVRSMLKGSSKQAGFVVLNDSWSFHQEWMSSCVAKFSLFAIRHTRGSYCKDVSACKIASFADSWRLLNMESGSHFLGLPNLFACRINWYYIYCLRSV